MAFVLRPSKKGRCSLFVLVSGLRTTLIEMRGSIAKGQFGRDVGTCTSNRDNSWEETCGLARQIRVFSRKEILTPPSFTPESFSFKSIEND